MSTKHTPEPWWSGRDPSHYHSLSSITGGGDTKGGIRSVAEVTGPDLDEQQANTTRIVACVNACTGMADPAAEIARLREAARQKHEWEEMAEHAGLPMSPHEARACVESLRSERDLAVKELESLVDRLCLQSPYEGCGKVSLDSAREALKRLKGERR